MKSYTDRRQEGIRNTRSLHSLEGGYRSSFHSDSRPITSKNTFFLWRSGFWTRTVAAPDGWAIRRECRAQRGLWPTPGHSRRQDSLLQTDIPHFGCLPRLKIWAYRRLQRHPFPLGTYVFRELDILVSNEDSWTNSCHC